MKVFFSSSSSTSMPLVFACVASMLVGTACENPNPLAPVDPIGTLPVWGQDFGKQAIEKPEDSLLNKTGDLAPKGSKTDGGPKPDGTVVDSAATVDRVAMVAGRTAFLMHCARCHGPQGRGLNVAMVGQTADLQSKPILSKSDAELTATIQQGRGNMPAFAATVDADKIKNILAWLRAGTPK